MKYMPIIKTAWILPTFRTNRNEKEFTNDQNIHSTAGGTAEASFKLFFIAEYFECTRQCLLIGSSQFFGYRR